MYITHAPCINCAKIIIQAGITRVVFGQFYKRTDGLNLLIQAGILTQNIKDV